MTEKSQTEPEVAKPRQIPLRKRIVFSLVVLLAFFAIAECVLRGMEWVRPPRVVDLGLGFNEDSRVFTAMLTDSGTMKTQAAKRVSFVDQQFKHPKPAGTYRIVALGGSSVHYLQPQFQSLAQRLTERFQSEYDQVEIINCGGFAYGSHRLVLISKEVVSYQPDLILLYTGHNEFEEVEQLSLSNVDRLQFDRVVSKSAIIRFIRDLKSDVQLSQLETEHNQRVMATEEPVSERNYARAWTHEFTAADVQARMQNYEHNLRLILTLMESKKIPVIMSTVCSNLLRPYLPQAAAERYEQVYDLWSNGKREEGLQLAQTILAETPGRHQCSQLENNILRRLAEEYSLPLVDVASLVASNEPHGIPGETLFDDHCHLNQAGRNVWINGFVPEIMKALSSRSGLQSKPSLPATKDSQ